MMFFNAGRCIPVVEWMLKPVLSDGLQGHNTKCHLKKKWFREDQMFYIWLMLNFLVYGLLERNLNYKHSPQFYVTLFEVAESLRYVSCLMKLHLFAWFCICELIHKICGHLEQLDVLKMVGVSSIPNLCITQYYSNQKSI